MTAFSDDSRLDRLMDEDKNLEKCPFEVPASLYALTGRWAEFDTLGSLAVLVEAAAGHLPVFRRPQFLLRPEKRILVRGQSSPGENGVLFLI